MATACVVELGIIDSVGESIQIDLAERIELNYHQVLFVWPSAKPVPAVHACW